MSTTIRLWILIVLKSLSTFLRFEYRQVGYPLLAPMLATVHVESFKQSELIAHNRRRRKDDSQHDFCQVVIGTLLSHRNIRSTAWLPPLWQWAYLSFIALWVTWSSRASSVKITEEDTISIGSLFYPYQEGGETSLCKSLTRHHWATPRHHRRIHQLRGPEGVSGIWSSCHRNADFRKWPKCTGQ
ncbi:hypothetical protein BDR03DRAFT_535010 [Suillus americanus]|nr:hypothetical protein BDR03DRAFT_535010 [Suillus americanus]